jgi:hypothetical protein
VFQGPRVFDLRCVGDVRKGHVRAWPPNLPVAPGGRDRGCALHRDAALAASRAKPSRIGCSPVLAAGRRCILGRRWRVRHRSLRHINQGCVKPGARAPGGASASRAAMSMRVTAADIIGPTVGISFVVSQEYPQM